MKGAREDVEDSSEHLVSEEFVVEFDVSQVDS